MGRSRCPVKSARRRSTPALNRRYKNRRVLPKMLCETIIEEPGVEKMLVPSVSTARSRVKPVCCKSTRPAHSGNSRHTAILASPPNKPKSGYRLSPARLPAVQTTPDPRKEEELNLTETPGSTTSTNTEKDSTFSFDVDDSDCSSTASSSSSSLPSPEIFRRESSSVLTAHALTFSMKEEEEQQQGPHLHIKNSTLLDVSHAEAIHIHDPPDLSVIIDAPTVLAEKICDIRNHKGPAAETSTQTGAVQPAVDKSTAKPREPPSCLLRITGKRPMLCKKKVSFKSPFISETFGSTHSQPATRSTTDNESSSPVRQMRPDVETSDFKDETPDLNVNLKRPVENSPEPVQLFDFASDSERDMLFEMMRVRSVKMKTIPLFPLTAAQVT